jgi:SAM-dependent methyltransferase
MDRGTWLAERRAAVRKDYDDTAAEYDLDLYPATLHPTFVDRLLATCPRDGIILDAPCGTGRYFAQVRAAGRRVVGADQSAGMLAVAASKGLADDLVQVGLQEMEFEGVFDAAMTIDAMENVSPEDWPVVLANLRRAVRPGADLYLTVEEVDAAEIDAGFAAGQAAGWPLVHGEVIEGDTAGYHYYPGRERVLGWFAAAGLTVVDEVYGPEGDWGYRHWLVRTPEA